MKKDNKKDKGTFIRLSQQEMNMLSVLKNKHFMNISSMIRKFITDMYNKLENNKL